MKYPVMLKSNQYGIHLILDPNLSLEDLGNAILQKFYESAKFFRNAKFAISFSGRDLSTDEEAYLVNLINENTDCEIICIVDEDEVREEVLKRKIDDYFDPGPLVPEEKMSEMVYGDIAAGESYFSEKTLIVAGNVEKGATVSSKENIIILGALKGSAYAGCEGFEKTFVYALDIQAEELKIGNYRYQPEEKKQSLSSSLAEFFFANNKKETSYLAFVELGKVKVVPAAEQLIS